MHEEQVQFRYSQRKPAACSLKTEYTVIEYVPVAGARASATSAIRQDDCNQKYRVNYFILSVHSDGQSENYWLVNVGLLPTRQ